MLNLVDLSGVHGKVGTSSCFGSKNGGLSAGSRKDLGALRKGTRVFAAQGEDVVVQDVLVAFRLASDPMRLSS